MNKKAVTIALSFLLLLNGMLVVGTSEVMIEGNTDITQENGAFFDPEIINYTEEVKLGDEVFIEYSVTNTGDAEGTQDIILTVEIDEVNIKEGETHENVTLGPGQELNNTFTYDTSDLKEDYGQNIVEIVVEVDVTLQTENASDAATLTVISPGMIPGFTFILLVTSLTFAVIIYHKMKR